MMRKWTQVLGGLLLGLVLSQELSGDPSRQSGISQRTECRPRFPFTKGWLGGDGVFSVPLNGPDARTLWLFGDTFVHRQQPQSRAGGQMIANSIAISRCVGESFLIDYHWRQDPRNESKEEAFFQAKADSLWPGGGLVYQGQLTIFGLLVRKQAEGQFSILGTKLIQVPNSQAAPSDWTYTIQDFETGPELIVGVSVVQKGDYALLFSSLHQEPGQPMVLLRCPLRGLSSCRPELLTNQGWKLYRGDSSRAKILLQGASTEFSVYRQGMGWGVVYNSVANFPFASTIDLALAERLEEGFTWTKTLANLPTQEELGARQGFCYASKDHPHMRPKDQLLVSYVCNSFDFFGETIPDLNLYRVEIRSFSLP